LQESTLLMTILHPHVLPFGVISTGSFTPLHTNLPGLETALHHLARVFQATMLCCKYKPPTYTCKGV